MIVAEIVAAAAEGDASTRSGFMGFVKRRQ
jgi:hypothetical protein